VLVDGNEILHISMFVSGCVNSDGNRHTLDILTIFVAGAGG
jgi:hypothetical protein